MRARWWRRLALALVPVVAVVGLVVVATHWLGSAGVRITPTSDGPTVASSAASSTIPTLPAASTAPAPAGASTGPDAARPIPVFAYFYQWFTASSWSRAKIDYPLAGRYSSDSLPVLQQQVKEAKAAGINGFFTSWKSTDALNSRLDMLLQVAHADSFEVGVVYEALDFSRAPLPVATVEHDLTYLVSRWGPQLTLPEYGKPVVIWTGTDKYTTADVAAVRAALGDRVLLLASAHTVAGYERVANLVDGEAYYWSSADPTSAGTLSKMSDMSKAVHAHGGLWFAPAASGFDGRPLGGTRVIDRHSGSTLVTSLKNAFASSPDAVALISWNEWSENTYIEPSQKYGTQELAALTRFLAQRGLALPVAVGAVDSSQGASGSSWTGARAAVALGLITMVMVPGLSVVARRRSPRPRHRRSG